MICRLPPVPYRLCECWHACTPTLPAAYPAQVWSAACSLAGPSAVQLMEEVEGAQVVVASRNKLRHNPKVGGQIAPRFDFPGYSISTGGRVGC